jgi:hypothetical protein
MIAARKTTKEAEDWVQNLLGTDPSLVSQKGLIMALKHRAPIHVIRFMLAINPNVISIPKEGPTPLQVAVQYSASLEVVQTLLEACPFGLCVTNPDYSEDPLSYAKRHHKDRPGLIELLSRPLSYWVTESKNQQNHHHQHNAVESYSSETLGGNTGTGMVSSSLTPFSRNTFTAVTTTNRNEEKQPSVPSDALDKSYLIDHEEIQNIKTLCSQLLKAHKKLSKQVVTCKNDLELQSKVIDSMNKNKADVLQELHEQQKHHFYRQLIALDMKEKAFKAQLSHIEEKCLKEMDARLEGWKEFIKSWKESTRDQIQELQVVMDHEVKVNAHFRNDLAEWMEEQHQQENRCVPSFVFATNLGEMNEEAPLCGSQGVEVTLDHVKKRPWRPLFKNWDRIMLVDADDASPFSS